MITGLEALTRGETNRLMLLMPPGSAKSTYATRLFPAWWMACHPSGSVLTACNTAGLAEHFGRDVRGLLAEHGARLNLRLRADARAAGRFTTDLRNEYYATGVHGAITGRRADLIVIDDPISTQLDASRSSSRERLWDWYRAELITRTKPQAKMVLVMTRWHTDDLAGRLLQQGGWTAIRLPALAEVGDVLGRTQGEALWPAWEDRNALLAKQTSLGERCFSGMFQQAPHTDTGSLFDITKLQFVDAAPEGLTVRAWDLAGVAGASGDPDWTVGVKLIRDELGGFVVQDVRRTRSSSTDVAVLIRDVAHQDGTAVTIGLPRDPGQAAIYQIAVLTRLLAGFRVANSREVGSKHLRAEPVASQIAAGNLRLLRGHWNDVFLEELALFPNGRKDDQVDALARAFAMLAPTQISPHYTTFSFLGR